MRSDTGQTSGRRGPDEPTQVIRAGVYQARELQAVSLAQPVMLALSG
ncbi:hypothetical protein DR64_7899 [Paraburkholderia xenovorans LB400]|nr:hypothetical protein DR64_7899 [Paraburkholderia xenovorans LB400]